MFRSSTLASFAALAFSTLAAAGDRGETRLDDGISSAGETRSSQPEIAASGSTVHVVWTEDGVAPSVATDVWYRRSTDGGKSFLTEVRIDADDDAADSDPKVSASGDLVVIVWLKGDPQDIWAVVSTDGGANFDAPRSIGGSLDGDLGDADHLRVIAEDPVVHVVFEDDGANPGLAEDVYAISSTDQGASFGGPMQLNDSAPGTFDADDPEIAVAGGSAFVVWVDDRNGQDAIWISQSDDSGASWSANVRLDTAPAGADVDTPLIDAKPNKVYVIWLDDRNPVVGDQVYYTFTDDNGSTWTTDIALGGIPVGTDIDDPAIVLGGPRLVYVAWADNRNGAANDVFVLTSTDAGKTFGTEVALDSDLGTVENGNPRLVADGEQVYCLYDEEDVGGEHRVQLGFNPASGDADAWHTMRLSSGLGTDQDSDDHEFALTDFRDVVAVWVDDRAAPGNDFNDIYTNGLRLPQLELVQSGNKLAFELHHVSPGEEGLLYLCVFSATGKDWTALPDSSGIHICLTPDAITFLLIQPWALALFSDTIAGGTASTIPVRLKFPGHAVGVVVDGTGTEFPAATDPLDF